MKTISNKEVREAQITNVCLGVNWIIWASVFAAWGVVGLGYFVILGDQWYGQAVGDWQRPAWYAYPWDWPGPTLAESLLTYMGLSPWDSIQGPIRSFSNLPRYLFALFVNMVVATIPLIAVAFVFRAIRWRSNEA